MITTLTTLHDYFISCK